MHYLFRRHVGRLLSFIALLGLGIAFQSPLVRAQDGGGQPVSGLYELVLRNSPPDRVCVNHELAIRLAVRASLLVTGGEAGRVRALDTHIEIEIDDPTVLDATARQATGNFADEPYTAMLTLKGLKEGRTIVTVVASGTTNRFGAASSFRLVKVFTVRVVPCQFQVDGTAFWATSAFGANLLVSVHINAVRLSSSGGVSFSGVNSFYTLNTTTNRLKDCGVDSIQFVQEPLTLSGEIIDDSLHVTLNFVTPDGHHILDCTAENWVEDGQPDHLPPLNLNPAELKIEVPLAGGSWQGEHILSSSRGDSPGRIMLNITPIKP